jgi:tryptophan synthase alpha chain
VSRRGTTGEKSRLADDLEATVARARRATVPRARRASVPRARCATGGRLPIAVGFGIARPEDAARVARIADGVVVGSALVARAERDGAAGVERLARTLAEACRR